MGVPSSVSLHSQCKVTKYQPKLTQPLLIFYWLIKISTSLPALSLSQFHVSSVHQPAEGHQQVICPSLSRGYSVQPRDLQNQKCHQWRLLPIDFHDSLYFFFQYLYSNQPAGQRGTVSQRYCRCRLRNRSSSSSG